MEESKVGVSLHSAVSPGLSVDEHRPKRVKREQNAPGEESQGAAETEPVSHIMASNGDGDNESGYDIEALAAEAARVVMANAQSQTDQDQQHVTTENNSTGYDSRVGEVNGETGVRHDTAMSSAPDVDFSSAPSDPVELALWVARQISNFQQNEGGSTVNTQRSRPLTHPPALYTRRLYDDDDPVKAAERERQREENRERKKRWRESNSERSTLTVKSFMIHLRCLLLTRVSSHADKDNDLRCRINKRAKQIWGSKEPAERSAWMEAEFNRRRAKRETKERFRILEDGFPGFSFAPGFGNSLFPTPGVGPQGDTNAAGLLLVNALLGVGSNEHGRNANAASALKSTLNTRAVDPRPFTEALRAMAANSEIMNGINAVLGVSNYDDNSGEEDRDGGVGISSLEVQPEINYGGQTADSNQESEIVKALNAATAMLNEMNEARREDPSSQNGEQDTVGRFNEEVRPNDQELDQAQIDALLAVTNGKRILLDTEGDDDDDDDDDQSQTQDDDAFEATEGLSSGAQPDSDISATLQHIIQQVVAQREGNGGQDNVATTRDETVAEHQAVQRKSQIQSGPSQRQSDPFDIDKNPALALSSLLQCAGMSINTVMPAAQSHATSQLYARLSESHHQATRTTTTPPTPSGGGINPAHASVYGSTAAMNRRLLTRPNAFSRPLHTSSTHTKNGTGMTPSSSNAAAAVVGGSGLVSCTLRRATKEKSVEEERKARSFGFPPLPGQRIGGGIVRR